MPLDSISYPDPTSAYNAHGSVAGGNPHWMTGYFLQFLIWKFSNLNHLHDPALKRAEYLWTPDDLGVNDTTATSGVKTKGLLITTSLKYDPTDAQQRAALLVKRSGTRLGQPLGIGDKLMGVSSLLGDGHDPNVTPTLGQNKQIVQVEGQHTIFCVHGSGAGAEVLGIEVWHAFIDHMQQLRDDLGLHTFRVGELSPAGRLKEFKENWAAVVVITYTYQRSTLLYQESPILKGVSFEFTPVD